MRVFLTTLLAAAATVTPILVNASATTSGNYRNELMYCRSSVFQAIKRETDKDVSGFPDLADNDAENPAKILAGPSGRARVGECVAKAGFVQQGYTNAIAALKADGSETNENILSALIDIAKLRHDHAAVAFWTRREARAARINSASIDSLNKTICGADSANEQSVCNKEGAVQTMWRLLIQPIAMS